MNERDPLDLSALDPMEDAAQWQAFVEATLSRVDAVLPRAAEDPFVTLAAWSRQVLLVAAAVLVVLIPVEIVLEKRETRIEQVQRLVSLSADWDQGEAPPTGEQFLRALRAETVR